MYQKRLILCVLFLSVALFSIAIADERSTKPQSSLNYKVTPKVIYGQGAVVKDGKKITRDLWMDVYETITDSKKPRPALIMTFGGAFHRGSPRLTFHEGGAQDTSMGDYCRKFAARGYVCFAIDYRLAPENPVPQMDGYSKDDLDYPSLTVILDQVNHVRREMGLKVLDVKKPEDEKVVRDMVICPAEDLRNALRHVRSSADKYNIDPERIVLGGFSAGAITTLNVAHGMREPVAGAFLLSGVNVGFDIPKATTADSPPVLMFVAQNDLQGAFIAMPKLLKHYEKAGVRDEFCWVPGFGHFYPAGATSLSEDGTRMSVEERIAKFLEEQL